MICPCPEPPPGLADAHTPADAIASEHVGEHGHCRHDSPQHGQACLGRRVSRDERLVTKGSDTRRKTTDRTDDGLGKSTQRGKVVPVTQRLRYATLLAVAVLIVTATMASGSIGDPLIIGGSNSSTNMQTEWEVTGGGLYLHADGGTVAPLHIVSADGAQAPGMSIYSQTVGVEISAPTAIQAGGAVKFSSAGLATIAAGKTSVTIVPGIDITANTKVLVTPQSGGGTVQRVGRNASADSFQIVLTKAATQTMTVAYFVIS